MDGGSSGLSRVLSAYAAGPIHRGRSADAVVSALREAILDGALRPDDWLREGEIAAALSVSRTPVRQAIAQLVEEGLARKATHQGATVARLSSEDVLALYVVRESLEGLAARLAARSSDTGLTPDLELIGRCMQEAAEAGDALGLAQLNLQWHRRLREATDNAYLDRFLLQVEQAVRRLPVTTFARPGRAAEVLTEHQDVLEALCAGDAEAAEKAARAHMRHARAARFSELLDE